MEPFLWSPGGGHWPVPRGRNHLDVTRHIELGHRAYTAERAENTLTPQRDATVRALRAAAITKRGVAQ
jgi:hypothetical protein